MVIDLKVLTCVKQEFVWSPVDKSPCLASQSPFVFGKVVKSPYSCLGFGMNPVSIPVAPALVTASHGFQSLAPL